VTVLTTSTANDRLSKFGMVLNSLTLTSQSGSTASLIPAPIQAEFLHVNGVSQPLLTVTVPQGVYTTATASVGSEAFECVAFDPSSGDVSTHSWSYGYTPQDHVTVSLPTPLTIAGNNALVKVSLQVSQSASYDKQNCLTTSSNFSITPTFTLTLASDINPMEVGLKGFISATPEPDGSFAVTAADGLDCGASGCGPLVYGPVWQVAAGADTVYQGISGFPELGAGVAVDMDAALQPDGSLLAKRIAVYDANPSNLSATIGPVIAVFGVGPVLYNYSTEELGAINFDMYPFNFSNATFQISGQFGNLQTLPFPANFGATNMVPGQNIYASTHSLVLEPPPIDMPATTVTLIPQTINGTVSAVSSVGSFTVYTITLAPYDLFPDLAAQLTGGRTNLLTNPNTVVVYADSNTQILNTTPIAVGGVARFYGLVFNDSGTLRMDCAQINDGVAE
jgi:hypothetical protein